MVRRRLTRNASLPQELGYVAEGQEVDGKGICPYDPHHNSTVTFVGKFLYQSADINTHPTFPRTLRSPAAVSTENTKGRYRRWNIPIAHVTSPERVYRPRRLSDALARSMNVLLEKFAVSSVPAG